jgi:hypothetical protein
VTDARAKRRAKRTKHLVCALEHLSFDVFYVHYTVYNNHPCVYHWARIPRARGAIAGSLFCIDRSVDRSIGVGVGVVVVVIVINIPRRATDDARHDCTRDPLRHRGDAARDAPQRRAPDAVRCDQGVRPVTVRAMAMTTMTMRTFARGWALGARCRSRRARWGVVWRVRARGVMVGFMVHTRASRAGACGARRARGRGVDVDRSMADAGPWRAIAGERSRARAWGGDDARGGRDGGGREGWRAGAAPRRARHRVGRGTASGARARAARGGRRGEIR